MDNPVADKRFQSEKPSTFYRSSFCVLPII
mgnify:CR=1 FL=1